MFCSASEAEMTDFTFKIWVKEPNELLDSIYLSKIVMADL